MYRSLMLGTGLCWTVTYVLIIRRGVADRTYGMPLAALCANLSWEFIFSFVHPAHSVQLVVNLVWFTLDLGILTTAVRFGPAQFPGLPAWAFGALLVLTLATAFCAVLFTSMEFHDRSGVYAAFAQSLLMSAAFLSMLYRRRSLAGQSASIALAKLVGTACASAAFAFCVPEFRGSVLLPFLYVAVFVLDALYLAAVLWARANPAGLGERGTAP